MKRSIFSPTVKGPGKLLRIRPEIFDFGSDVGLKGGKTKPKIPGTAPTDWHTTIPTDSGPMSVCFHNDPKLLNCEIAQPSLGGRQHTKVANCIDRDGGPGLKKAKCGSRVPEAGVDKSEVQNKCASRVPPAQRRHS